MRHHKRIKLINLALFAFAAAFLFSDIPLQETVARPTQQQARRRVEIIGSEVPFDQRIGEAEGALFAIHFTGDTRGRLGPCG